MTAPHDSFGMVDLDSCIVGPDASLLEAMTRMTETAVAMVLVVDEARHLLGVVVDGDIRRALVRRPDVTAPIAGIMTRNPRTAPHDVSDEHLRALADEALSPWLPLVDEAGVVRGLVDLARIRLASHRLPNAVVLMAGGKGQRLMPHTAGTPKPMMPIGGRPILEVLIRILHGHGFERFYVSINYLASQIEDHFGDGSALGVQIDYLRETEPRGTAGSLALVGGRETMPFVVMNGDLLTRFNPRALLALHAQEQAMATVAVRDHAVEIPFGVVDVDGVRVSGIREKPVFNVPVNAGIYVLNPSVLARIPASGRFDMPDLLSDLVTERAGSVAAFHVNDYWIDIGRSEDLDRARAEFHEHF
jgi:dTDP-glucose pyrophosphorylase